MTIVIQFQYWDLKVSDTGFEIGLSFSDVPERLEIPFSAVRGFYDPSVNFELEFDVKTEEAPALPAEAAAQAEGSSRRRPAKKPSRGRSRKPRKAGGGRRRRRVPTSCRSTPSGRNDMASRSIFACAQTQGSAPRRTHGCREPRPAWPDQGRESSASGSRAERSAAFLSTATGASRDDRPTVEPRPQAVGLDPRPPHQLLARAALPRRAFRHRRRARHRRLPRWWPKSTPTARATATSPRP